MLISTLKAEVNGVEINLTYDEGTQTWSASSNAPGLSSFNLTGGYYNVKLTATDVAGNVATIDATDETLGDSLKLSVYEVVKPTITITYPNADAHLITATPTITIQLRDNDSGIDIDTFSLKVDQEAALNSTSEGVSVSEVEGGYDVTYTPTTGLSNGEHTIVVNVSDNDNNAADATSVEFTVDTVDPTLDVTSPTDNMFTNNSTLLVSGITNDATSSPVTVTILLNEVDQGEVTVESSGAFSKSITLAEGANTITIKATDSAGNETTITRTVTLVTALPEFLSVVLTPNPVQTGLTFTIQVKMQE